tara:strand:+ start:503 stop:907 length:405 start_codon:yes stop_codon:yes gene_type:complete
MNKYFLYISTLLNGLLLMKLFGAIPFFLYLSIIVNLIFIWYIKKVVERQEEFENNVIDITSTINSFSVHLEDLYQLEMFYGDENLEKLLEHSKDVINDIVDFQIDNFDAEENFDTEESEEEGIEEDDSYTPQEE